MAYRSKFGEWWKSGRGKTTAQGAMQGALGTLAQRAKQSPLIRSAAGSLGTSLSGVSTASRQKQSDFQTRLAQSAQEKTNASAPFGSLPTNATRQEAALRQVGFGTPQLPASQQNQAMLAEQADAQGLTGADRQAYIEQGSGIQTQRSQDQIAAASGVPTPAISDVATPPPTPSSESAGTPGAPISGIKSGIQSLQDEYTSLFEPSEEEKLLADQLTSLQESARLGVSGQERQGRGIPLGLIRGKQEQIMEQANIQAQTLEQRLANLQAQRQSRQQALQTQLQSAAPFEFGGALVRMNPTTGELETVAEAPQQAMEPIKLSAGETLYDPNTGEVLFSVPENASSQNLPASIQEYLFAAGQGYTGSFADWQASGGAGAKPLSAEASKLIANAQSGLAAIETMFKTVDENLGRGGIGATLTNREYLTAKENLVDIIGRMRSGGAITAEEADRFEKLLPSMIDTDELARKKLTDMQQLLNDTIAGIQGPSGSQQNDPLQLGFNGVGTDTYTGAKFSQNAQKVFPTGTKAGQCGRFVNNLTGIGMGDSFQNKMSFTDPSIKVPKSGDVFVMPYSWTGHTGIVSKAVPRSDGTYDVYVVDSNWGLDEKIRHHVINSSKIAGYARPGLKSTYQQKLFV